MKKNIPFPTKGGSYTFDGNQLKREDAAPESKAAPRATRDKGAVVVIRHREEPQVSYPKQAPPPAPTTSKRRKSRR
jgi:hypothetical protein